MRRPLFLIFLLLVAQTFPAFASSLTLTLPVPETMSALLAEEDTDHDQRITVEDTGDRRFTLHPAGDAEPVEITGPYHLANLLQELALARDRDEAATTLHLARVFEPPANRISRTIRERFWDALTRRIDVENLAHVLPDEKFPPADGRHFLYVPSDDRRSWEYFSAEARIRPVLSPTGVPVTVEVVPLDVSALRAPDGAREFLSRLEHRHGLLSLALETNGGGDIRGVPYVVPGGRFNEMYGWDSYFETLGLLEDGRIDLARAMVDNFVYEIRHYGKILNANRTYYLTRSQPPFLIAMARAVYAHLPCTEANRDWLRRALLAAIEEYRTVWTAEPRLTPTGLSRYRGQGVGVPPEVEEGHFRPIFRPYAERRGVTPEEVEELYRQGLLSAAEQAALDAFFVHDRAVRESGHDTTYRWYTGTDRCADFVTVDLNSLLYRIELEIARTLRDVFGGSVEFPDGTSTDSATWFALAARRRDLIRKYLWDPDEEMFFDYDLANARRHRYFSATAFYPLWSCPSEEDDYRILAPAEVRRLVANLLAKLEEVGGIAASAEVSRRAAGADLPPRQWDWPYGWAPHQMLAWQGLADHGFEDDVVRLVYRWLYTIARNAADYNGLVPEKFDVVKRSHAVFAEYGNVGTDFSYITREGFGWMNASFQVGLAWIEEFDPALRNSLNELVPPEEIFR